MPDSTEIKPAHDLKSWWRDAKFGLFIHWGLYSIPARGEWVMNRENIPLEKYARYAEEFNPKHYNPRQWAKLAKAAGMRYAVLTTKHHEGYCLWDSKLTNYTSAQCAAKRDLVREYVEAFRAEGIRVGLYFSLMDWHHPDGDIRGYTSEPVRRRFIDYVHGQVRELLTNYGKIDILWYDVWWPYEADGWESHKLYDMAKQLQPEIIINDRSGIPADFSTCEQQINPSEAGRDWEAIYTLNDNWGYHAGDHNWKSAREVIMMLAEVSRNGGNFLLNVGPDRDGIIPAASVDILRQVGAWLERNGECIYGTQRLHIGWINFGKLTAKGNTLYLLVDKWVGTELTMGRLSCVAQSARMLATGESIKVEQDGPRMHLSGLPAIQPEHPVTVIAVEMDRPPKHSSGPSTVNMTHAWSDPNKGIPL